MINNEYTFTSEDLCEITNLLNNIIQWGKYNLINITDKERVYIDFLTDIGCLKHLDIVNVKPRWFANHKLSKYLLKISISKFSNTNSSTSSPGITKGIENIEKKINHIKNDLIPKIDRQTDYISDLNKRIDNIPVDIDHLNIDDIEKHIHDIPPRNHLYEHIGSIDKSLYDLGEKLKRDFQDDEEIIRYVDNIIETLSTQFKNK